MEPTSDADDCKIIIHSNAHKLLFGSEVQEIKVKQELNPIAAAAKDSNKRVHRAPQLQKAPLNRNQSEGYSQKYMKQKSYPSPKKEESYSPAPVAVKASK